MSARPQKIELNAQPREILGSKVRHLRRDGFIPAVLYGKGMESKALQIPSKDFEKALKTAGESTLVYLNIGKDSHPTIIHDVSKDPLSDAIVHADFYKVSLTEKIKTKVPVVFIGESPAVKNFGGIFVRNMNELEVEALPQNLPHEITIDISELGNIGDQVLVKDLKLGTGVEIVGDPEEIISLIQEPLSEEELKKQLEGEAKPADEVEIVGEKEKAEAEAAEGEEAPASEPEEPVRPGKKE